MLWTCHPTRTAIHMCLANFEDKIFIGFTKTTKSMKLLVLKVLGYKVCNTLLYVCM